MPIHLVTKSIAEAVLIVAFVAAAPSANARAQAPASARIDERVLGRRLEDTLGAFVPLRRGVGGPVIYGLVENHLGELVAKAGTIHIRSLIDGSVAARAEVNELAEFTARDFKAGVYVAELVDRTARVIVTTEAFTAHDGDIIRLVPVIPVRPLTGFATVLRNTTKTVVSSAASMGVLAVSPGTPVSPQ
jgi:hypothetical protein